MLATSEERGKKRPAAASDRQSLADDVCKILLNLQNNDAPVDLTAVHLFVKKPHELGRKDGLVLVATKAQPIVESEDFKLFQTLCYDNEESGASAFLISTRESKQFKSPEAAMSAMVAHGVAVGLVPSEDADRLSSLYSTWMRGQTWTQFSMTHYHRPSLKNWKGWPWELIRIENQSLSRGLHRNSPVSVHFEDKAPSEFIHPDSLYLFKEVWSIERGQATNIVDVVNTAIEDSLAADLDLEQLKPAIKKRRGRAE